MSRPFTRQAGDASLTGERLPAQGTEDERDLPVRDERVALRAEQDTRSFTWLLTPDLAERLARDLSKKGWIVTIEPLGEPGNDDDRD